MVFGSRSPSCSRAGLLAVLVVSLPGLSLALGGCGDGSDDGGVADAGPAASSDAGPDAAVSIRGMRYCEILLAYLQGSAVDVEVWGTQGLSLCPAEAWEALDDEALRVEYGATAVRMNGPRYFLIDRGEAFSTPDAELRTFGALEMQQLATLTLTVSQLNSAAYAELTVNRDTQFDFWAGSEVYELTSATGEVYVMQAYSQIVDASLSEADLPTLGERLELPAGWSYSARVLDAPLEVFTPGEAVVVQDELQNTYSRISTGQ